MEDFNEALKSWLMDWGWKRSEERLGQAFVNDFIKTPWPELFYEEDNHKAQETIENWLKFHHYYDELPPKIGGR